MRSALLTLADRALSASSWRAAYSVGWIQIARSFENRPLVRSIARAERTKVAKAVNSAASLGHGVSGDSAKNKSR